MAVTGFIQAVTGYHNIIIIIPVFQSIKVPNSSSEKVSVTCVMCHMSGIFNPRRACAARGTWSVCVCVCVSNLRSCASTCATRNTYGFSVTRIEKSKSRFL